MASKKVFGGLEYEVEGFSQMSKALKKTSLGGDVRKALKDTSNVVVNEARSRLQSDAVGPSRRSAAMYSASATQRGASVKMNPGSRFPWAWGLEFGSKRYRQFEPWRGNQWVRIGDGPGYYLQPAIREKKDEAIRLLDQRLSLLFDHLPDANSVSR